MVGKVVDETKLVMLYEDHSVFEENPELLTDTPSRKVNRGARRTPQRPASPEPQGSCCEAARENWDRSASFLYAVLAEESNILSWSAHIFESGREPGLRLAVQKHKRRVPALRAPRREAGIFGAWRRLLITSFIGGAVLLEI